MFCFIIFFSCIYIYIYDNYINAIQNHSVLERKILLLNFAVVKSLLESMTWLKKVYGHHLMGPQSVTSRGIQVNQRAIEMKTAYGLKETHLHCETNHVPINVTIFSATTMVKIITLNTNFQCNFREKEMKWVVFPFFSIFFFIVKYTIVSIL